MVQLEVVVVYELAGEREVLVLGEARAYYVYLAVHVELVVRVIPTIEHVMLRRRERSLGSFHLSKRAGEVVKPAVRMFVGVCEVMGRRAQMSHVMGVCRHVVVEESLPVGGQERHEPVAAVSHIGERLHLRRRAVDDALHLIVALYAERAARNALIAYLLQRIVGIAVPRVVYLFYHLRVPQVLEDILPVEPSGEVALLLIPV